MSASSPAAPVAEPAVAATERRIARLLFVGALVGVALLVVGVALMAVRGVSPTSATWPPFDPGRLFTDIVALRPEGYLWAGIVVLIATPVAQVVAELTAFLLRGERLMAAVAAAILGIIALSVALAVGVDA